MCPAGHLSSPPPPSRDRIRAAPRLVGGVDAGLVPLLRHRGLQARRHLDHRRPRRKQRRRLRQRLVPVRERGEDAKDGEHSPYTHAPTYGCMYAHSLCCNGTPMQAYARTPAGTHTHIHIHARTHTLGCIHTHTLTHTPTNSLTLTRARTFNSARI